MKINTRFDDDLFLTMVKLRAIEQEKIDNPMGFDRKKPFDLLPLLSSLDISALISKKHLLQIGELNIIAGNFKYINPSREVVDSLLIDEFRMSNLIENIESNNGGLKAAWSVISNNQNYSVNQIEDLSRAINPKMPGIRKMEKGRRVRIVGGGGIIYTPPKSRKILLSHLNDLANNSISSKVDFFALIPLEHYQYESAHPLWDGNGRSGRLIMLKRLMEMLDTKIPLQLSQSIFETRHLYFSALNAPRLRNDYNQLLDYFLGVIKSALICTLSKCQE